MEKHVTLRFYEELNDFLPKKKKKNTFDFTFEEKTSVKDIIESVGVPHTEVDLIVVNGESVAFNYIPKDLDHISVFPMFESLDISNVTKLREKPLREPKFVLDVHLGKLAKFLRLAGFDTLYQNACDDPDLARISANERRILLTRDIGLLKRKKVTHGYFLRSQNPEAQLKEVLKRFDLYGSVKPFNRCIKCNGKLERVDKEAVRNRLEPLTLKYFNVFFQCSGCRSIFWEGSHYERMKGFIDTIQKGN
jgi:uncharacterized protein with PIN domain